MTALLYFTANSEAKQTDWIPTPHPTGAENKQRNTEGSVNKSVWTRNKEFHLVITQKGFKIKVIWKQNACLINSLTVLMTRVVQPPPSEGGSRHRWINGWMGDILLCMSQIFSAPSHLNLIAFISPDKLNNCFRCGGAGKHAGGVQDKPWLGFILN